MLKDYPNEKNEAFVEGTKMHNILGKWFTNPELYETAPEMFSLLKKHIRELYETSDTDRAIEALIARIEKSSDE